MVYVQFLKLHMKFAVKGGPALDHGLRFADNQVQWVKSSFQNPLEIVENFVSFHRVPSLSG